MTELAFLEIVEYEGDWIVQIRDALGRTEADREFHSGPVALEWAMKWCEDRGLRPSVDMTVRALKR